MLIVETGCWVYGNPTVSLHFFCKSKTVLKLKVYFTKGKKKKKHLNTGHLLVWKMSKWITFKMLLLDTIEISSYKKRKGKIFPWNVFCFEE